MNMYICQFHSKYEYSAVFFSWKISTLVDFPHVSNHLFLLPVASCLLYEKAMICLYNFAISSDATVSYLVHMAIDTINDATGQTHFFVI